MYCRFEINGVVIKVTSSSCVILDKDTKVIEELGLSGKEASDRLLIQKAMDDGEISSKILYNGNFVFPSKKLLTEFRKMKKTGSIEKMSDSMYHFLTSHFDIAHYDKHGYIVEYDGSYEKMINTISSAFDRIPDRFSDVKNIIDQHFNL